MSGHDPGYTSALQQLQYEASAAHHQALASDNVHWPRAFIKEVWHELIGRAHNAHARGSPKEQHAAAVEVLAIMKEFAALSPERARDLAARELCAASGGPYDPEAVNAAFNKAVAALPALSKFMAERAAAAAERQRRTDEAAAAAEAERQRNAPQALWDSLRRRSIELKLIGNGNHIGAIPAHLSQMTEGEIETIRQRRADFLALLRREAESLVPVQIV